MTQDESMPSRIERVARARAPGFEAARQKLAQVIAAAEQGRLIEQTERAIFDELNRLKTTSREVALQARVDEAQAAFSPSGTATEVALQGDRPDDATDAQRAGVDSAASLAAARGRQRASR